MLCKCCMHTNPEDSTRCDRCGFPLLFNDEADVDATAAQYRSKRIDGISVAVKLYHYGHDAQGEFREQSSEYVRIADASALDYQKIMWLDMSFDPPEVERTIELEVRVDRPTDSENRTLRADVRDNIRCIRLGIMRDEGLTIRLAAGDPDRYVLSERMPLIRSDGA